MAGMAAATMSARSEEIARQLRALREKRGLSQTDLAKILGVKQTNVSMAETRNAKGSVFRVDTLEQWAWALDVDLVIEFRERVPGVTS